MKLIYPNIEELPPPFSGFTKNVRTCEGHVSGWGECINFVFDSSGDYEVTGRMPRVVVIFDSSIYADGEVIVVNGVTFTVSNQGMNTDNTFVANTGNSKDTALSFLSALLSNPNFQDVNIKLLEKIPEVGQTRVSIFWEEFIKIDPFINSNTLGLPMSSNAGVFQVGYDGYGIAYQIIASNDDPTLMFQEKIFPTSYQFQIADVPKKDGLYDMSEIEVSSILRAYVKTRFRYNDAEFVQRDEWFRMKFWLRYGIVAKDGCEARVFDLKETEVEWVYNTAIQVFDRNGLCPYMNRDTGLFRFREFLTRRKGDICICGEINDWLWIILNDNEYEGVNAPYTVEYIYYEGYTVLTTNTETFSGDGVYSIPSGFANTRSPDAADKIIILVNHDGDRIAQKTIKKKKCKYDTTIYFLSDLGGYDVLCFKKKVGEVIEVDREVQCVKHDCLESSHGINFEANMESSNKQVVSVKGMVKVTAETDWFDSNNEDTKRLIRSFVSSPSMYVLNSYDSAFYDDENFGQLPRSIYLTGNSYVTDDKDGKVKLTIEYYYDKEQNVQI